ncbi:MAG: signal peptidase I [Deltaproteobacteria bacterium]|nr:signal peptidase I [Deltaproteobacteria bacterium]
MKGEKILTQTLRNWARSETAKRLRREITFLATLILIVLAARSSLADHYHVPSGSMLPTLQIGDHVLVNKLAYGARVPFSNLYLVDFNGPIRGDVVVLDSPEDGELLIKRVVATPGDRIAVSNGRLILNGQPVGLSSGQAGLIENLDLKPHPINLTNGGGPDYGPRLIPDNHYLVMGDNRGNSNDGRYFGLVERSSILGQAVAVFYGRGGFVWRPL